MGLLLIVVVVTKIVVVRWYSDFVIEVVANLGLVGVMIVGESSAVIGGFVS